MPNAHCPECGSVLDDLAPAAELHKALEDVGNLQRAITEALRDRANAIRRMEDASPDITRQDNELFVAWCEATGRSAKTKYGAGRQAAIKKMRRAGYSQDDLLRAVALAGKYRYLVYGAWRDSGSASDRRDDLIDILKDEKRIESLLAKGVEG